MLRFELTLAVRFLREGRFQSALIIGGVAVGVAVVVYISALISGLQANTINRTLGASAHVVIKPPDEIVRNQIPASETLATKARRCSPPWGCKPPCTKSLSNSPAACSSVWPLHARSR